MEKEKGVSKRENAYQVLQSKQMLKDRQTEKRAEFIILSPYFYMKQLELFKSPTGKVTALDAELFAIRLAISKATVTGCKDIIIFTDNIPAAKRAMDTSIHSGQGHSIAMSRLLRSHFITYQKETYISGTAPVTLSGLYKQGYTMMQSEPNTQWQNKCTHHLTL